MSWTIYHNRGEILRTVMAAADERRDGVLPMDVDGVAEKFHGELDLLASLQLKWHTRLAGNIEKQLMDQPMDLEGRVIAAWHRTADELPGVLEVIETYRANPLDDQMAVAMAKSHAKEHLLLAVMSGLCNAGDTAGVPVGARIEQRARETYVPAVPTIGRPTLLDRIRDLIAA